MENYSNQDKFDFLNNNGSSNPTNQSININNSSSEDLRTVEVNKSNVKSEMKVYSVLAISLLLTGLIGLLVPYFLRLAYPNDLEQQLNVASLMSIIAVFPLFISSFAISMLGITNKKRKSVARTTTSLLLLALLVCSMSVILSPLVIIFQEIGMASTLYLTFVCTGLIFVGLGLLARFTKLSFLSRMLIGLSSGLMLLFGINLIVYFSTIFTGNFEMMYLVGVIVQAALLVYMIIYAMFTFKRINECAKAGLYEQNFSLVVAEAADLYASFINIFIRILYFVLMIFASSRKN